MTCFPDLPSNYEIRILGQEHICWAAAIVMHSNIFYSSVWSAVYPEDKPKRLMKGMKAADYLIRHQIDSGYSLGVFDKGYVFKYPDSIASGGKLYWDMDDDNVTCEQLLDKMDFPLVSVALAYDSVNTLDIEKLGPLISVFPTFTVIYKTLGEADQRDPSSWQATGPGEVVFRNGTSTRRDYSSKGLMAALARYMMHWLAAKGFRGIQIDCMADAVSHVWICPPQPFTGRVVSEFDTKTYGEEDANGCKLKPFYPAEQRITKVYCQLS